MLENLFASIANEFRDVPDFERRLATVMMRWSANPDAVFMTASDDELTPEQHEAFEQFRRMTSAHVD